MDETPQIYMWRGRDINTLEKADLLIALRLAISFMSTREENERQLEEFKQLVRKRRKETFSGN